MQDTAFVSLLDKTAALDRCTTEVGFEKGVLAPEYARYTDDIVVSIMPAKASRYQSILGEQTDISHHGYLRSGYEIEIGDVLVWKVGGSTLAEDIEAGATQIPVDDVSQFAEGDVIEIGGGVKRECGTISDVTADSLILTEGLKNEHALSEPVVMVRRYEILHICSWPGLNHHTELALKEITA